MAKLKTKFDELKGMNVSELETETNKSKLELLKMKLSVSSRQSKEFSKLKDLRKHIARAKTVKRMMKTEKAKENPTSSVIK